MKKAGIILSVWYLGFMIFLTGCEVKRVADTKKDEVEFTVVEDGDIPAELKEIINANKKDEIKMSYEDGGYMYVIRGYGEQKSGGYSIAVNELYMAKDGLHVNTSLLGPPPDKKLSKEPSYPYLVLKTQCREAAVVFM